MGDKFKTIMLSMLDKAEISINGSNPWDITVHNEALYERVVYDQALGLGEAYMDGWWDCPSVDKFFHRILSAKLDQYVLQHILQHKAFFLAGMKFLKYSLDFAMFNKQNKRHAFEVGERHYDTGNDLFQAMLDQEMNYTCGYWKDAANLDAAQMAKLKLVCDKLQLKPNQRLLDIGCGWGSLARYAAEHYQNEVVGVTISEQQMQHAKKLSAGLPIEFRLQDYREVNETFDNVVSLGMFEHVGIKNYRTYMKLVNRSLKDDGLFLLHTIGGNISGISANPWINKYIFPNGMIPSLKQITKASEGLFVLEDLHNFGAYYDDTLMAWYDNFNQRWDVLKHQYQERFRRMWNYYLLSCAGAFRARHLQLWQFVFSKDGVPGGYVSVR